MAISQTTYKILTNKLNFSFTVMSFLNDIRLWCFLKMILGLIKMWSQHKSNRKRCLESWIHVCTTWLTLERAHGKKQKWFKVSHSRPPTEQQLAFSQSPTAVTDKKTEFAEYILADVILNLRFPGNELSFVSRAHMVSVASTRDLYGWLLVEIIFFKHISLTCFQILSKTRLSLPFSRQH